MGPVHSVKLFHNVINMELYCPLADAKDGRDIPGTFAVHEPLENLFFTIAERVRQRQGRFAVCPAHGFVEVGSDETQDSFVTFLAGKTGEKYKTPFSSRRNYFPLMTTIISLKLSTADSRFSIMSLANKSGSGRLSRSARLLSFSQVISRLVLSRFTISS